MVQSVWLASDSFELEYEKRSTTKTYLISVLKA